MCKRLTFVVVVGVGAGLLLTAGRAPVAKGLAGLPETEKATATPAPVRQLEITARAPADSGPREQSGGLTGTGEFVEDARGGAPGCWCGLDTEGNDFCFDDLFCTDVTACSSSADCPAGERCLANNCCPPPLDFACFPVCPEGCVDGGVCGTYVPCTPEKCAQPGPDCWTTVCGGGTQYDFSLSPVPADFFYPGSAPFDGVVELGGATGFIDTVIDRLDQMCFPDPLPSKDKTQIVVTQLDLVSCLPITVQPDMSQWLVYVELDGAQPIGNLIATKKKDEGGTFNAEIPVKPRFRFESVIDPTDVRILAPGLEITLGTVDAADWLQDDSLIFDPCSPGDGFAPGWNQGDVGGSPCCEETCHAGPSPGHEHCTLPPKCSQPCQQPPECQWDNGPPLDDWGQPASQYDWDFPFSAEAADDFILPGDPTNPCVIQQVTTWVKHFGYSVPPGPPTPKDYKGVTVTVYADVGPTAKGPAGNREDDGTFTEYVVGGLVYTVTVPVGGYTWTREPLSAFPCKGDPDGDGLTDIYRIDIPVNMVLEKNVKYWLVVQPNLSEFNAGWGQTAIMLSQWNTDHPAQQIFPAAGLLAWTKIAGNADACPPTTPPAATNQDLAFQLTGKKWTCNKPAPPGPDCFATQCGDTQADFSTDPIPADFFDPGSLPFDGVVDLGGATGWIDTVIQRYDDMCFDDVLPVTQTTTIELVQLDLVSCAPITVQNGDGTTSQWDVQVGLSQIPAPLGTLTATKEHLTGGHFNSIFYVQPRYTFTRVTNPADVRVFDTGMEGIPPIEMRTDPICPPQWSRKPDFDVGCGGIGFFPGVDNDPDTGDPCCEDVCHANPAGGHEHCAQPPKCYPKCPPKCRCPFCGDLNGDGAINLADFVIFAGCFGAPPTTPGCECADLNGDGVINLADFVIFAGLFGSTPGPNTPPNCP